MPDKKALFVFVLLGGLLAAQSKAQDVVSLYDRQPGNSLQSSQKHPF